MPSSPTARIRIETIRARDLSRFADGFHSRPSGQVTSPISRSRALAQSRNPFAAASDPGLLVAFDGDRCVGHQGLLPGPLESASGSSTVLWLSAGFVLPEYRTRLVAIQLTREAIRLGRDLAVSGITPEAGEVLLGMRFQEVGPYVHPKVSLTRLDVAAWPFRALEQRLGGAAMAKVAGAAGRASRRLVYPVLRAAWGTLAPAPPPGWQPVTRVEPLDARAQPATAAERPRLRWGVDGANWMLSSPWAHEGLEHESVPGHFSDARTLFRHPAFALTGTDGRCQGWCVLLISKAASRSVLKLAAYDLSLASDLGSLFRVACSQAVRYRVDEVELGAEFSALARSLPLAARVVEDRRRRMLIRPANGSSPLGRVASDLELSFEDGDYVFT